MAKININKTAPSSADTSKMSSSENAKSSGMAFSRINYMIILGGVVLLIIGYLLMIGGGSENLNEFNEKEIFSARRITVSPIVLILGFLVVLAGIMYKAPRKS